MSAAAAADSSSTPIPNAIWRDSRLSAEAKGTLGYLIARPPEWVMTMAEIGTALRLNRGKLRRIFRELISAGYVERLQQRSSDGGQFVSGYRIRSDAVAAGGTR